MDEIIDGPMAEYDVTCTTAECDNSGIELRVTADATDPTVICGVCGAQLETRPAV